MGNQTSRIVDKNKDRKAKRKTRRRSSVTLSSRSYAGSLHSHGNYDWIDHNEDTQLSAGALNAAMAAAAAASSTASPISSASATTMSTSSPAQPRRKSITEFFTRRKASIARPSFSEDEFREYDRLQRQHYLLKSARKSNLWAPIHEPTTILDIGTANGIWAMEMASQYPQAQIFGADIRVPPEQPNFKNLKFLEMDIHQPWPLSDNSVDFVFQRNMGHFIQKDQWPFVLREMLRVLKPNGYIELVEPDLWHHNPGPVLQAFDQFFQNLCNTDLHIDYAFTETLKDQVEAVGFVDIEQRTLDIPIGEWPQEPELKQFGFINKETQKALLKNRRQFYMTKWNLSSEDYDTAVVEVLEEFEEYRGFQRFNCWIARKAPQNVS